MKINKKR